jgi:hypothetical protein
MLEFADKALIIWEKATLMVLFYPLSQLKLRKNILL